MLDEKIFKKHHLFFINIIKENEWGFSSRLWCKATSLFVYTLYYFEKKKFFEYSWSSSDVEACMLFIFIAELFKK